MEQTLRSKLNEIGTLRLIPKTLALRAVQRQRAASTSASPEIRLQQGVTGGEPTTTLTNPRTFAQTPNFKVSIGQVLYFGTYGGGGHDGFGLGLGLGQVLQLETNVKKIRLRESNRARVEKNFLEAIVKNI